MFIFTNKQDGLPANGTHVLVAGKRANLSVCFKCNNELLFQKKRKQSWHQVIEIKFHQRPQNLPLNWGNQQMRKDHLPW